MKLQVNAFEDYVDSLAALGVYPSFHRHSKGWFCILRNASNKQLMPMNAGETCWGETIIEALTVAVENLNTRFGSPRELHRYIETGSDPNAEASQTMKSAYAQ